MQSGVKLKIIALLHILIAIVILIIAIIIQPATFFCTGTPLVSFQLFVLSWWIWRLPNFDSFKERWLIFTSKRPLLTPEQHEQKFRRAWLIQLIFVLIWGWVCALIFWGLATWMFFLGGCAPVSMLLIADLFVAVVGWVLGGAWVIQGVFRD
ncbi:MAG: hypothetical protein Q6364_03305 [Candidatus Hermodarchaeota archaeon]|nr:hypothetical protein [Candidatus Hermodarchaeota archaeon]